MEVRVRGNAFDRRDRWREISLSSTGETYLKYDVRGTTFMLWNVQADLRVEVVRTENENVRSHKGFWTKWEPDTPTHT